MVGTAQLETVLVKERRAFGVGCGHRRGNIEIALPVVVARQLVLMGRSDSQHAQTAKGEQA